MKITLFFLASSIVVLSSCSSMYKAGQTPDDVYYSPAPQRERVVAASGDDQPEYYSTNPSDQYVRLKSADQARWSYFDDYNYYDSYYAPGYAGAYYGSGYGIYSGWGIGLGIFSPFSYWNSYYAWNSYYNPYFYNPYYGGGVVIVNPKYGSGGTAYNHLRTFNPASYRTVSSNVNNNRYYTPNASQSYYNNRNSSRNGNMNRSSNYQGNMNSNNYRPANNNSSYQPSSQPVRSYTPSSSGGGGGISRPGR